MGPGGAPEEAVAGIRAVGGGLQSQIHPPQYEIKQPRCGWEVGMAGPYSLAPPPGPSSGYKPPIQSRVAAGIWPLEGFVKLPVRLQISKIAGLIISMFCVLDLFLASGA